MHFIARQPFNSIDKHKRDLAKLAYLAQVKPQLGEVLDWVGRTYDYDLGL